jgi:hypothetical protein
MERVTERRRDDLGECGAQCTSRIGAAGVDTSFARADLGEMADLMNDGALLRNQEQQQKTERFEHVSHSNVSENSEVRARSYQNAASFAAIRGFRATRGGNAPSDPSKLHANERNG